MQLAAAPRIDFVSEARSPRGFDDMLNRSAQRRAPVVVLGGDCRAVAQ